MCDVKDKVLKEFFNIKGRNNGFVETEKMHLYLRRTMRHGPGQVYHTIEVAQISVHKPYRGTGVARNFFEFIEEEATKRDMVVVVECIHNKRLYEWLKIRRGYVALPWSPSDTKSLAKVANA